MRKNSIQSSVPVGIQKFKNYSAILMDIVCNLNKKALPNIMYSEIFIDINNALHNIFSSKLDDDNPIFKMIIKFDELLSTFRSNIQFQSSNMIMDDCIPFKFIYYNIAVSFPNGKFNNEFVLDDKEAELWWSSNLNNDMFVEVNIFWSKIEEKFKRITVMDQFLKSFFFTTNTWFNEFISKVQFNIFLRFFGGWKDFENTWLKIHHDHGHMIMCSLEHAIDELEDIKSRIQDIRSAKKSYMFCLNCWSEDGLWNIVYINENDDFKIKTIKSNSLLQEISDKNLYLYPKGKDPETPIQIRRRKGSQPF